MPATFNRLHNWALDEIITTAALNAEFDNILTNLDPSGLGGWSATVAQMRLVTSPGAIGSESLATALSGEIQRLRYMIQAILGSNAAQWYATPVTDLTQIRSALGSTLATSKITSGPSSLYSSASRFLLPGNSTPTVSVLGQTTAVVYAIGGQPYTISSNLVVGPLTLAPAASAIVADAGQVGQESSKWQGEDSSTLLISNASASITNLIGSYAAFKVVSNGNSEYFMGFVNSASSLTNCLRGYFFSNSASAVLPIDRIPISNGNTISLCKLTWLYGNTASAVVVGYTPPSISNATPSSPAIGDYWFNLATQVWMTYNSSVWMTASATLLGVCVQDTANTIAARSFDPYAVTLPYSNLILANNGSASLIAQNFGSKLGVGVNLLDFKNTRPVWSSTVMDPNFSTAFSASTTYWAYIGEQGQLYLSNEKPYQSANNGQGWYHPYEVWRAVGYAPTNSSTAFSAATLTTYPLDANSSGQQTGSSYNFLVNGAFDFWCAIGTAASVTSTTAAAVNLYGPDQWYINNNIQNGTAVGIMTMNRQIGTLPGSYYGFKGIVATTAAGVAPSQTAYGVEIGQVLSSEAGVQLLGQTASFAIQVKAAANVNAVGITFMYSGGTATKTVTSGANSTAIGTELTFQVNSTAFTQCVLKNVAMGTAPGVAGCFGVRIRATGVSTGKVYDANNGLIVEQAQWNLGPNIGPWQRQNLKPADELSACQFFFETSYPVFPLSSTTPYFVANSLTGTAAICTVGYAAFPNSSNFGTAVQVNLNFATRKRTQTPSVTIASPSLGRQNTADLVNVLGGGFTTTVPLLVIGTLANGDIPSDNGLSIHLHNMPADSTIAGCAFHWWADARI